MRRTLLHPVRADRAPRRGFLLLLIVGLLAVLLVVIVGFLSFTRTELTSVAHVRDRADTSDLAQSAMDWTLGNIGGYLFDPATKMFDPTKYVSNANDTGVAPTGDNSQWWYAPYDPDTKTINNAYNSGGANSFTKLYMQQNAAAWKYMPDDFFPDGSIAGRFAVQVVDANSVININDWTDDCNPTQCQMAHMIQGAQGLNYFEQYRANQDANGSGAVCTIPYFQAWSVASRTVRYFKYNWSYTGNYTMASPNYITTNTQWTGMFGPEYVGMKTTYYDQYLGWWWGQPWWDQCGMASFDIAAHVDPDTGRSPMNVNTCEVSGNQMPFSGENYTCTWPLEGIFNIESIARIIKVGKFYYNGTLYDAQAPRTVPDGRWSGPVAPSPTTAGAGNNGAWQKAEMLKLRLAYRYQEMMVRYFCGKYKPYLYGNNYGCFPGNFNMQWLFRKGAPGVPYNGFQENRSYYQAFTNTAAQAVPRGALTASEANKVKHAVKPDGTSPPDTYAQTVYYKNTRFPCGLDTFRQWVADDFLVMTQNNRAWGNSSVVDPTYGTDAGSGSTYTLAYGDAQRSESQPYNDDDPCVNFDSSDTPDVVPGKMDKRTANAIFDNIIPGKVWKDASGNDRFLLFGNGAEDSGYGPYALDPNKDVTGISVRDPLWELYSIQLGRDEYDFLQTNRQGFYSTGTGNSIYNEKGHDVRLGDAQLISAPSTLSVAPPDLGAYDQRPTVPWRQLAFGPDWFSTELTVTSPCYYLVVTSEIVDAKSAKLTPASPTVLTHYQTLACVELAADIKVETDAAYDGTQWPTGGVPADPKHQLSMAEAKHVGLGYYRGNGPRRMKTMPAADPRSMDYGMKTASQVAGKQAYQPALPDTSLSSYPGTTATSVPTVPTDWVDFRNVKPGDEKTYYQAQNPASAGDKGRETTKRAIVRWTWTINQGL